MRISNSATGETDIQAVFEMSLDVYPHWLNIACEHLQSAERAHVEALASWQSSDEDVKVRAFEAEFQASMQCVVAAAIAIDAFYARVKENIPISPQTIEAWAKKRTARYRQISEVFKRGFRVGPKGATV